MWNECLAALPPLQKVVVVGLSVQLSVLRISLHVQVIFRLSRNLCWVIASQYLVIGSSKLPCNDIFVKGHTCGFWLPPADNVWPKGITGLHRDTMWYVRDYISCHISETGILSVRFLLLVLPVSDIQYPKYTDILHGVRVIIIKIWINLPPILWWFRWWIRIERCGCQWTCCVIAASRCHFSHLFIRQGFFIIAEQIRWIERWLIWSTSHCGGEEIGAWYFFGVHYGQLSKFGMVLILHILQKRLLVLGGIGSHVLRIYMHGLVRLPKR